MLDLDDEIINNSEIRFKIDIDITDGGLIKYIVYKKIKSPEKYIWTKLKDFIKYGDSLDFIKSIIEFPKYVKEDGNIYK